MRPVAHFDEFADHVRDLVQNAASNGAQLGVLPEYFTVGLLTAAGSDPLRTKQEVQGAFDLAGRKFHQPYRELFSGLASQYGMYLLAGTQFYWNEDENRFYNAAFFFHPDGGVVEQRKVHVTYELLYNRSLASAGETFAVIDTDFGRVGITVCYDAAFPEVVRMLALQGMELLLNPVCVFDEFGVNRFRAYGASRATENQCYVVNCQVAGAMPDLPDPPLEFRARSSVHVPIDVMMGRPTGRLADAATTTEQILYADLDFDLLRAYRKEAIPAMLRDRRAALYRGLEEAPA